MRFLFLTIIIDDLRELQNSVYLDSELVFFQSLSPCEYKTEKDNVGIHITEAKHLRYEKNYFCFLWVPLLPKKVWFQLRKIKSKFEFVRFHKAGLVYFIH